MQPAATIKVTEGGGTSAVRRAAPTRRYDPVAPPTGGTTTGRPDHHGRLHDLGRYHRPASAAPAATGATAAADGGQTDFRARRCRSPTPARRPSATRRPISPVQINAKKNGGSYDLTVKFAKSVMDSPATSRTDSVKPSMDVKLGGADKGIGPGRGPDERRADQVRRPDRDPRPDGHLQAGRHRQGDAQPGRPRRSRPSARRRPAPRRRTSAVSLELDTSAQPGGASGGGSAAPARRGAGGTAAQRRPRRDRRRGPRRPDAPSAWSPAR